MRSTLLKAAVAALLVSSPLSMAYARGHDHGGGRGSHEMSQPRASRDDEDNDASQPVYGKAPLVCMPWQTVWACMHDQR